MKLSTHSCISEWAKNNPEEFPRRLTAVGFFFQSHPNGGWWQPTLVAFRRYYLLPIVCVCVGNRNRRGDGSIGFTDRTEERTGEKTDFVRKFSPAKRNRIDDIAQSCVCVSIAVADGFQYDIAKVLR